MGHDHSHNSVKNIKVAFFLNLFFTLIELVGGYLTNSVAIMADALHDFGDSVSLGLAWFLEKYSKKGRSKKFTYGYKRLSLLGALINSAILVVGSVVILYTALPGLLNPEVSNYTGMLFIALLGIAVNGLAVLRLRSGKTMNEKVVSWHLLEDVFGWVAILLISIVNHFIELPILDPLAAIVFTLIILFNVIKNFKQIGVIFLQGTPSHIDSAKLQKQIVKMKDVVSVHDLHMWSMDDETTVLTLHVVVKNSLTYAQITKLKCSVRELLSKKGIQHVTVEIEKKSEICDYEHC